MPLRKKDACWCGYTTRIIHTMVTSRSNFHGVTKVIDLSGLDEWIMIGDPEYLGIEKLENAYRERVFYMVETLWSGKEARAGRIANDRC